MRGLEKEAESIENKFLSTFYIEIDYSFLKEPLVMNILLSAQINPPINFSLRSRKINNDDNRVSEIFKIMFGEQKNPDWLQEFMKFISNFDISLNQNSLSELNSAKYKFKMLVVLFLNISYNLLKYNFQATKIFVESLIDEKSSYDDLVKMLNQESASLNYGLSVLLDIYENMKFNLFNNSKNKKEMISIIFGELKQSIISLIRMNEMLILLDQGKYSLDKKFFDEYFGHRTKRLNATLMILSDLTFSQEPLKQEDLKAYLNLGKYAEIKITLLRDLSRKNVNKRFYKKKFFFIINILGKQSFEYIFNV